MKQFSLRAFTLIFATAFVLVACKKQPVVPDQPNPGPMPGLAHTIRFEMDELPGIPNQPPANLFVQFDVKNEQNELVLSNKKLAISFDAKFKTEELQLPAGNYKITKLMVVSGTGNVLYAVPVINSAKAQAVTKPLPYTAILPHPVTLNIAATFLKVEATDKAVDFGYPADAFPTGNIPDEGGALSIRVKAAVKVGELMYDSIPASLMYRTFDANNQLVSVQFISLAAGTNTIQLSATAERHELTVRKWNVDYKQEFTKAEVRNNELYMFGGEKEAKKLKAELVYKWTGDKYTADSKKSFFYNGKGQLDKIEYYLKRSTDNSPYMSEKEVFEYNNGQVAKINRYDENSSLAGFTSFTYNGEGKVNRISEEVFTGVKTDVSVAYSPVTIDGLSGTSMHYSYSNTSLTMDYYQRIKNGNRISENSRTSNNDTETGELFYDNNINPYAHMNWQNLFLSNTSKNNPVEQQRTYYGSYPTAVAFSFEYKYDDEGYPIELVQRFKSYISGEYLFTKKTVYSY